MSEDLGTQSFAESSGGNHRGGGNIPAASGATIDGMAVNVDSYLKANLNDIGKASNLDNLTRLGGIAGESIFASLDAMGDTFAPFKFSAQPAIGPIQHEFSDEKAGLSHATVMKQMNAEIEGHTGALSKGQGQGE